MNNTMDLKSLKIQAENEIKAAESLDVLNTVFKRYFGKQGELTLILRGLENLPKDSRAKTGQEANELKNFLKKEFDEKIKILKEKEKMEAEEKEWIDVTAPGKKLSLGHLHPLTLARRKVEEIFQTMGFSVLEGPEIENEWYNFDALNIPKDHPARDMWDTFWLKKPAENKKQKEEKLLLRTHTSPVQIRYMEKNAPPLRIIAPGRVFRHEATDASHEINFCQVEGLMIGGPASGYPISVANLKAIIQEFFQRFFGKSAEIRLRPSYFPFVEPGFEVDMKGDRGWMEMAGAGMVH